MSASTARVFLDSVAPHLLRLVSYARHVIGSQRADAEELLHDALLTCHRRIEASGFAGEDEAMLGYLFQQIKYEYQGQQRNAQRHPLDLAGDKVPDREEEAPAPVGPCPDAVHTYLHRHHAADDVQIWEYHLQGLHLVEIGFLVGMGKSTVHRRLEKLRADLRREFRGRLGTGDSSDEFAG